MKRLVYDLLQVAGLVAIIAGTWGLWGWAAASLTGGALVIGITFFEALLIGRRS